MAGGLNKVMIIGNVGRDPEMRYTPGGAAVTSFSVAVSRRWTTPENEVRDETEWFNVVAWNKLAETCNSLITKGRKVYIEGRLQTRSWEGPDGQKKYRDTLSKMTLKTPVGDVKLDANRQAIGTTFITEVVKDAQGNLYNKVLRKIDNVNQTLGLPPAEFKVGSRDEPNCP